MDKITFREATFEDSKITFDLSNDKEVRNNSINKNQINWEEHLKWLKNKLEDRGYKIYLFYMEKVFVGQVKFEINAQEAVISISISEEFRGQGLAQNILEKSIQNLISQFNNIKTITAYIKQNNIASTKSFSKIGFIFEKEEEIKNEKFKKYKFNTERLNAN